MGRIPGCARKEFPEPAKFKKRNRVFCDEKEYKYHRDARQRRNEKKEDLPGKRAQPAAAAGSSAKHQTAIFVFSHFAHRDTFPVRYGMGTKPCSEMIFFPSSVLYRFRKSDTGAPSFGWPLVYIKSGLEIG